MIKYQGIIETINEYSIEVIGERYYLFRRHIDNSNEC